MLKLFKRFRDDSAEISRMVEYYGKNARSIVKARANDDDLTPRDRRHWKRIYRGMLLRGK